MSAYFYRDNIGKEIGPLNLDTLSKLRLAGVLNENTFVRSEDTNEWKPLREFLPSSTITQTPPKSFNKSTNWTWAGLFFAGVIILGAWYFSKGILLIDRSGDHSQTADQRQTVIFADNFNDNKIDFSKWATSGNTVTEANQVMQVLTTVMDGGGNLTSTSIPVNPTGKITVTRRVYLHYGNNYFIGQFGITIGALPTFSVRYANMNYAAGSTYMSRYGFFLTRNNARPDLIADQVNVSPPVTPVWDAWFNEKITYDPVNGVAEYFINNVKQLTFNVGVLPQTASPTMGLTFSAWGWYTGHEHDFDDLLVIQDHDRH